VIAPFALGLGGNAVTVSGALWGQMKAAGAPDDLAAREVGRALAAVIRNSAQKLRFGVVHQHSGHNYELRYWLAASGIDPDHQVEIVVLPPPLMADALATGRLDGYCVGEPWNSIGVANAGGRIATVKASIWPKSPEKVLGVTEAWAVYNPQPLAALLRALYRAAQWCGQTGNHEEAARLLARPAYLDVAVAAVRPALSGRLELGQSATAAVEDFFVPFAHAATFPSIGHALWFYSQMVRWGDVAPGPESAALAGSSFRPDIYRAALGELAAELPPPDRRTLGADAFFDGKPFDPDDVDDYIESQRLR